MTSNIKVSPDNPYGEVTIPRAKLSSADDNSVVIGNPMALNNNDANPYGSPGSAPPPYMVKEDAGEEEVKGCRACCYRCRRKK